MTSRGLRREREILDAAAEVFAKKGYSAASVEDVASMVGMLKGSLYYYVDSKEDLLYRLTKTIHQDALATLETTRALDAPPRERLVALIRMHFEKLAGNIAYTRVFYHEFRHLTGERYEEIASLRHTYEEYVQGLIESGQADGTFCLRRDPRITMIAVLTLLNAVQQWYRADGGVDLEAVTDEYVAFILGGLQCPSDGACPCAPTTPSTTATPRPRAKRRNRDEGVAST